MKMPQKITLRNIYENAQNIDKEMHILVMNNKKIIILVMNNKEMHILVMNNKKNIFFI